jgi:polysaccharide biosynthesis protein PslH
MTPVPHTPVPHTPAAAPAEHAVGDSAEGSDSSAYREARTSARPRASILYLAAFDVSRPSTGTATRGLQFLRFLAERYEVHLVYMAPDDAGPMAVRPRLPDGLASVVRTPHSSVAYFLFSRDFLRAAEGVVRSRPVDVILADFEKAGVYGALLSRRHGIPMLYNSHDVEYRRYLSLAGGDWRRLVLAPGMYVAERWAASVSRQVVTITPEDAAVFAEWVGRDRVSVAPGGFDHEVYHPFYPRPTNGDAPRILFVGNMSYPPNREAVEVTRSQVMPAVLARRPRALFQFVGAHPPELNDGRPGAEFTGFVEDLVPYLRQADVVISPVLRGGGMRIKTIEALACGKPVVATEKGAEGVAADRVRSLTIVPLARFADAVDEVLRRDEPVTAQDFEFLRDTYSSRAVLERFAARLDAVVAQG